MTIKELQQSDIKYRFNGTGIVIPTKTHDLYLSLEALYKLTYVDIVYIIEFGYKKQ